ncbi:MAG: hypothetical protein H6741_24080 [Alphaproteobacteria bacterium]|nr:hypothetical protein [Alphaproteobacteria bacterium]MCB9795786.1 hypothetical protein [Alphaproteobacteria bacterium]
MPAVEPPPEPVGVSEYIEGMWGQRALTVRAGLDEALEKHRAGDPEGAAEWVMEVYRGSFEPELEPMVRDRVDPRVAAELEYGFGLTRDAMSARGSERAEARIEALMVSLDEAAAELDAQRAALE